MIATLAEASGGSFTSDLLVVLTAAALIAVAMQRMRLAVVPGYLITGIVVGPHALGLVRSDANLANIGHLAIILLLFGIGLQLHMSVLRYDFRRRVMAGVGSCGLSIVIGWPVGILVFGLSAPGALVVAMALSLSSTAVVLRIMADQRGLRHTRGRLAFSILIVQDILVVGMLVLLPMLARWASGGVEGGALEPAQHWGDFIAHACMKIAGASALLLLGKVILPRLFRFTAQGQSGEVMMILSVAVALGAAVCTQALGFSGELGAFLAGLLLAGTPFRHQLHGQIGPLRDLFMAVFFTTLGMQLQPQIVAQWWWLILIAGVVMTGIKVACIGGVCWALGATASVSVAVGFTLAQAGEFSLVLLQQAQGQGALGPVVTANTIAIVIITLVITPGLMSVGQWLAARIATVGPPAWVRSPLRPDEDEAEAEAKAEAEASDVEGIPGDGEGDRAVPRRPRHVIVGGYGPVGRATAERLEHNGVHVTIIEMNPRTVQTQSRLGKSIVFGDVSNAEVLESAGIHEADALILTIPDEEAVMRACELARRISPRIYVAARTNIVSQGLQASKAGADHVTIEEIATAEAMRTAVMAHLLAEDKP